MVSSKETTVAAYIATLSPERKKIVMALRAEIRKNLPKGYVEVMNWGMISYEIPLKVFPITYNKKPLGYAAIANQKQAVSLYLYSIYMDDKVRKNFENAFTSSGKRMDAGKCCIRFKKLEDIPLTVVGKSISRFTPDQLIQMYKKARGE